MPIKSKRIKIGDKIRAQLAYHKMSQFDLADALGTSQTTVSFWVNDRVTPRRYYIEGMAEVFGCSVEYLLGAFDDDEKTETKTCTMDQVAGLHS